jgi:hypothetical protein
MNRTKTLSISLVMASFFGVLFTPDTSALAQVVEIVPPEVVATTEPVYFEGHAAYWYGGRWMYRDGRGAWTHYGTEPPFLAERRMRFAPAHRYYGGGGYRGGWGGGRRR